MPDATDRPTAQPLPALHPLPARCEVLVVGAGPAGSACATALARAGVDVVLVDQHDFPRDKVCGDGLIPDAHAALARLGVLDAVLAEAQVVGQVRCVGPRGGSVDVPGTLAVLPRRRLDALLVAHARSQGAVLHTPWRFEGPIERPGRPDGAGAPRVVGARLRQPGTDRGTDRVTDRVTEIAADWVVLATGAAVPSLQAAGLCERREPSGVALRGYVRNPALAGAPPSMDVVWHRALRPGYGWVFPCGDGVYNVGVGAFFRRGRAAGGGADRAGLREVFEAFTRVHPPLRALLDGGEWVGPLKGAPLRCSLAGARSGRAGLLAVGEALGSTYDFTGEGIGKALETGLLAADVLLAHRGDAGAQAEVDAATLADHARALAALRPRFTLYERANGINRHPWLADLVIWRAQRSPGLRRRMTGVLEETTNPGALLSLRGLWRLMTV